MKLGSPLGPFLDRVDFFAKARRHLTPVATNVYIGTDTFYNFSSVGIAGAQPSGVMVRRSARAPRCVVSDRSSDGRGYRSMVSNHAERQGRIH